MANRHIPFRDKVTIGIVGGVAGVALAQCIPQLDSSKKNIPITIKTATPSLVQTIKNKLNTVVKPTKEHTEHIRALWVSRIQKVDTPAEIDLLMQKAKNGGYNRIMYQVYGGGASSTYFNSTMLAGTRAVKGSFDPLAYMIEQGKKYNIKVEAWINALVMTRPYFASQERFTKWALKDKKGKPYGLTPIKGETEAYVWLDPEHAEVQKYVKGIVDELTTNYDLDALHLDRIRFPDSAFVNKKSREALTKFVGELHTLVHQQKPSMELNAAVWGYHTGIGRFTNKGGNERLGQDSVEWTSDTCKEDAHIQYGKGPCIDIIYPMFYYSRTNVLHGEKPNIYVALQQFTSHNANRVVLGLDAQFDDKRSKKYDKNGNDELEQISKEYGIRGSAKYEYKNEGN